MTVDPLEGGTFTVKEGRDGWLFLDTSDDFEVMRLYTDPTYMAVDVVDAWRVALKARREYFASLGITHLTVIAPSTCLVYPEVLPADVELSGESPFTLIDKGLDEATAAEFLYLLDPLVAARDEKPTYVQTDSHWSDWGAFVGCRETMRHLAKVRDDIRVLREDEVEWETRQFFGALGAVMPVPRSEYVNIATVPNSGCECTEHVVNDIRSAYLVFEQDRPDLPTAVVFRDSGMTNASKFFSESFRRVVYCSHPNAIFRDLVEREKPDIVLTVMGERRLVKGPADASLDDFRSMFGDLLLDDPQAITEQQTSRTLLRTGDVQGALEANARALSRGVTARLLVHRSACHRHLGDTAAALEALRAATVADPADGPVWLAYGHLLHTLGREDEALTAYVRATEAEPQHPVMWSEAVRGLLESGHVQQALRLGAEGVDRHPTDHVLRNRYAWALAEAGSYEEAADELRVTTSLAPTVLVYRTKLASVLVQLRQWLEAEMVLEELVRDRPDQPEAAHWLAKVRQHLEAGV